MKKKKKSLLLITPSYLQCVSELGGMYGRVGLVRVLALSWVGSPRLVKHSLGECPPHRAVSLLLHQWGKSQVCWKNVGLCAGIADEPEQKKKKKEQRKGRMIHDVGTLWKCKITDCRTSRVDVLCV